MRKYYGKGQFFDDHSEYVLINYILQWNEHILQKLMKHSVDIILIF